ncbi:oxidoreductase family protein [Panaeolus papilionaceus]|nr:oxidoreductase family protein [Panaeolus papilionaceus]
MSTKSGVALLGAGIFAKEAHLPALATLGNAAPPLVAVYSRSEKSAQDLADTAKVSLNLDNAPAVYYDANANADLDALLARSDISAVIIALPITTQPSIVIKALSAGKHVISEKPVAPDVKSGRELIKTYNEVYKPRGLVWRIAENFEAEPGYRAVGAAIRDGKIGDVIFFKTVVVNHIDKESKWYKTPWRTVPDYQGGFLLDGGVHFVAALRVMLSRPLTQVSAFASLNKDYLKPHDTIHAIVKAGDKVNGTAELTWAFPTPSRPQADTWVITGSEGWISINHVYRANAPAVVRIVIKSMVKHEGKPDEEKEEVLEILSEGIAAELKSFFGAIVGQDDGHRFGDPQAALSDVAFIEAALNSDGQVIDLKKLIEE